MDKSLESLQQEVDEEYRMNEQNLFGEKDSDLSKKIKLIEDFVTTDLSTHSVSKRPPKYTLIEPSILFEFWGDKVLESYKKQTNRVISIFKRKDLKVPTELEQQFTYITNKISMLEKSIQTGQITEDKYKRSLINAINRELTELPLRSLEDFQEFEQNIKYMLEELLNFFDFEEEEENPNKDSHSITNRDQIFSLIQIPSEFILTNEEKTEFWGTFILTFYLHLMSLIQELYSMINPKHQLPPELTENLEFCKKELKKIKDDAKSGAVSPGGYFDLISEAIQREKSKKGSLLPPEKHRIIIMEKERDQISQYIKEEEEE